MTDFLPINFTLDKGRKNGGRIIWCQKNSLIAIIPYCLYGLMAKSIIIYGILPVTTITGLKVM